MALELVGGAFLSASLQVLFDDIHSVVDFIRRNRVDEDLLNRLENKLLLANGVLNDAEKQQITNPNVRSWLEKLKDAIHNTEDLVDEIKTAALRCQLEADRQLGFRVRNFFSSRLNVKDVERRIMKIIETVDDIVKDMERLGLRKGVETSIPFQIQRSSLNILAKESDVYGRDAEKEGIIKFLLSDGCHKISVMPIVGMGGIGKTTLAQLVYRDVIDGKVVMEKPFVVKEWITVADESKYDVFTLTKAIYEKVTKLQLDNTIKETFQLQLKLKEAMQGKRFLFVLDDVWNVDYQTWKDLQTPFESAANGSKIIVTTRLQKIAKDLGTAGSGALDLALLSEVDGWKLFSKHAFDNVEPSSYPHLEEIGRKIVKKCKGNPLAVKSLACLLHSQLNPKEWKNVLMNDIWELELEQGEGGILPALWLSYYYLPPHLKRCFAYCSIFPKDYPFKKENLIWLWMAENLLQSQNNMMLEEVGEKYFEDLTSRSFFLVDTYGRFTMHDLVNDLAKFVSGESCLGLDGNCSGNLTRKTRRISCMADETSDISKKMEDLSKNKVLRTLLVLGDRSWYGVKKQYNINPEELRSMQYLRVLSASHIFFTFEGRTKSLKSIGSLKLLRYLDLSYNAGIKEIPDTICKLYNLQTLLLQGCGNLAKLPDSIGYLKHLRHLNLSKTAIEKMPDTICNLHELRTLSLADCYKLTQLPTNISMLTNLCKLDIKGCKNCDRLPPLGELPYLESLEIVRLDKVERIGDEFYLKDSSSSSPPFKSLESLTFENMGEWKEWSSVGGAFPNLKKLELSGCPKLKGACLPIYLPSLEELDIRDNHHVVASLSRCQFPSLRLLRIRNCGGMKSFPQGRLPSTIQTVDIWRCDDLESLSEEGWPCSNLKSLHIRGCKKLFAHGNKWNLGMLTSLTSLAIEGVDMEGVDSFPEEEGQLPTTLTFLCLYSLGNLKSLNGRALRHLTSLQSLRIVDCQQLQCLAEERLPTSLSEFRIWECPLLKPRCQRGIGQDRDNIHHIPEIWIEGQQLKHI